MPESIGQGQGQGPVHERTVIVLNVLTAYVQELYATEVFYKKDRIF